MWCKPEDSLHSGQFTKFPSGGFTRAAIVKPPDGNLVNPTLCTGIPIDQAAWMSTSRKVSKVDFPAMPVLLFWGASCMYAWLCFMAIQVVEFSRGDTKLERYLPKNQHKYPRKIIEF